MTISNAEFADFLKDDGNRKVVLAEIDATYQVLADEGGAPATTTIRLADYPYNTEPSEAPGGTGGYVYEDCIRSTPTFAQSIDLGSLGGKTSYSIGQLEIDNADGKFDGLIDRITDGRECRFYLGAADWPRADFRNVLTAIVQRVTAPSQDRIVFELRDRGLLLNKDLVGADIGGTGPNSGRPSPIIMGFCNNVEVPLEDAATLLYRVADTAADPFEVYDAGLPLTVDLPKIADLGSAFTVDTAANTILHPALRLALGDIVQVFTVATMGLTSGQLYYVVAVNIDGSFQLGTTVVGSPLPVVDLTAQFSPVETVVINRYPSVSNLDDPATITLAHAPYGRITCDIAVPVGSDSPASLNSRASDIIRALVVDRGGVPSGNYVGPLDSYLVDNDNCDFHLGLAVTERRNMTDVLDDVLFSVNGFWGFDQFSNFIYGRIRPQDIGSFLGSPGTPLEIASDDVVDLASLSIEHLAPSYKNARGYFQKSWAQQTDGFAGGVTLDRISYLQNGGLFYKNTDQVSGTENHYTERPALYHVTMVESPDYVTLISNEVCAVAYAEFTTWLDDRRDQVLPYLEVIRLKTRLTAIGAKLGDVVNVTLDRYGYNSGALTQIVAISVDLTAQTIELGLIHRKVPDYITGYINYP